MMCNDISTKRCSAHFFLKTAVLKRTSGFATCRVRYVQVRYMFVTYMPNSLLTSFNHSKLCSHYEHNLPIPTDDLRELLRLILEENSFKFNERFFIQTHGIAMGTKTAVAFSAILWQT